MKSIVAILVPTLNRHEAIEPLAENVAEVTPRGSYSLVFVCDHGDTRSQAAVRRAPASRSLLCDGSYPRKINAGYRATNEELVLPTADDVYFREGWLERACEAFAEGIEVLGTYDTTPATESGEHATMPLIRRSYCESPGAAWGEQGTIFHEGYHHNYVETETCALAQDRGVWAFCRESVIEHRHPDWGTRPEDDTDRKGNRRNVDADRELFHRRRAEWSGALAASR